MLLSLIIPIYKVEDYIIECIESVCCQLCEGIEVIIVNDGTPDNSMLMARDYIQRNYNNFIDQFIFIDQENQGQSVARNNALKVAKGDYIAFLDSDDAISSRYFEKILYIIKFKKTEIIRFNSKKFKRNTRDSFAFETGVGELGQTQISSEYLSELFNKSDWYPWLNVYKRLLFKDLDFPEGVYFEDAMTISTAFLSAKSIYTLPDTLYYYRVNPEGSLNSKNLKNLDKIELSYKFAVNFFKEKSSTKNYYGILFVIFLQNYLCFLLQRKGIITSLIEYNRYRIYISLVDRSELKNRGNLIFSYLGFIFIVFVVLSKKIRLL